MISAIDLRKSYVNGTTNVHALDGVSFSIEQGEYLAIVGPSGSGKSTLMHILGCLDRPTAGRYLLEDVDVITLADAQLASLRNRRIGFVFQSFNLLARHTALENVALPLLYGRNEDATNLAMQALAKVGLEARSHHMPNELSGGERQRVAIARALVINPALVLADEPTGNLDTKTGNEILALFESLHEQGTTIILVTHDGEVAARAKRVFTMRDGKLVNDTGAVSKPALEEVVA